MDWILIGLGIAVGIYVLLVGGMQTAQRAWPIALALGIFAPVVWCCWAAVESFLPEPGKKRNDDEEDFE